MPVSNWCFNEKINGIYFVLEVYGGTLDTVNFAQYIFSEDIDAKDTVR